MSWTLACMLVAGLAAAVLAWTDAATRHLPLRWQTVGAAATWGAWGWGGGGGWTAGGALAVIYAIRRRANAQDNIGLGDAILAWWLFAPFGWMAGGAGLVIAAALMVGLRIPRVMALATARWGGARVTAAVGLGVGASWAAWTLWWPAVPWVVAGWLAWAWEMLRRKASVERLLKPGPLGTALVTSAALMHGAAAWVRTWPPAQSAP